MIKNCIKMQHISTIHEKVSHAIYLPYRWESLLRHIFSQSIRKFTTQNICLPHKIVYLWKGLPNPYKRVYHATNVSSSREGFPRNKCPLFTKESTTQHLSPSHVRVYHVTYIHSFHTSNFSFVINIKRILFIKFSLQYIQMTRIKHPITRPFILALYC